MTAESITRELQSPLFIQAVTDAMGKHYGASVRITHAAPAGNPARPGKSCNIVQKIMVTCHIGSAVKQESLFVKKWIAGNLHSIVLGTEHTSIEACALQTGILDEITAFNTVAHPYVAAFEDGEPARPGNWWLIMADCSSSLSATRQLRWNMDFVYGIIDTLAKHSAEWESDRCQEMLSRNEWLVRDENKFKDREVLAKHLVGAALESDDQRKLDVMLRNEDIKKKTERAADFLTYLKPREQTVWVKYLCDRSHLSAAMSKLPGTLVHGDIHFDNIGYDASRPLVLIDWECAGFGNVAWDLKRFLYWAVEFNGTDSTEHVRYFFKQYQAYGGMMSGTQWSRAMRYATILHGLICLPFLAGDWLWTNENHIRAFRKRVADISEMLFEFDAAW